MDFSNLLSSQPRGLYKFISDIRNAKSKDDERMRVDKELANIRNKFSNPGNLSSYDKKKYVWKMCYIYMLGYEVDFGHVEFISLLSSTKYSEKSVGYMAFSMMFRPGDELMTLAVNSMRNDIVGQIHYGQTLALSAVSNIGGNDLAEALASDVQRLIISPLDAQPAYVNSNINMEQEFRNKALLCKKSALCLLRLFRTNPECVVMDEWMARMARLLEDRDLGVVTSVMSLLLGFASYAPATFEPLVPYVVSILTRLIVNRSCSPDYLYYNMPSPWLQVKCFRFLQYYKIPTDTTQLELLNETLSKILVKAENPADPYNKINSENSVLFEAISLVISYGSDAPHALKDHISTWLGRFIAMKDPNIRYLGIDAMTRLAKLEGPDSLQVYQSTVLESLKDTDISVRKRALILIYTMTNHHNAKDVVHELLLNLPLADPAMKEDIVVKIAILAEKFCDDDWVWYLDTMVQAILLAGDYVMEAVWYRIVQLIVNNAEVHDYAAEKVLGSVQSKYCHETMVAVGGYLLGEIGVNICDRPGMTGYDQFAALHQHFSRVGEKVKGLLLTSYAKFVNLYPEQVKDVVMEIYSKHAASQTLELQQRACEYNVLATAISTSTVETVLNTMPAFEVEKKENVLMALDKDENNTADRPAWMVDNAEKSASRQAYMDKKANKDEPKHKEVERAASAAAAAPVQHIQKTVDLLSLDDDFAPSSFSSASAAAGLTADQERALERQVTAACLERGLNNKKTLLDTDAVHISVGHDYRTHQGRVYLYVRNKTSDDLGVSAQIASDDCLVVKHQVPSVIAAGQEGSLQIAVDCMKPFASVPAAALTFSRRGSSFSVKVPLPITVCSFAEPLPMDKATYMARWKGISAEGTEAQGVFSAQGAVDASFLANMKGSFFTSSRLGLAEGLDTDRTATGALTFLTGTAGADGKRIAVGALMRLEADPATSKLRVTVRATSGAVAQALKNYFVAQLGQH